MRLIVPVRFVLYITRKIFKVVAKVLKKLRYQGIGIAKNANLDINGDFSYGLGCGIGEGANIIIPPHANLNLGDGCYIGRYVEIGPGGCIEIGSGTSIQDRCILLGDVKIGRYCLFAVNIYISSGRHYYDLLPSWLIKDQDCFVASDKKLESLHSKPVVVEDDCWLGVNVVVMPGVTIGKGAVIGANSVVTQDISPYTVVAGAPAKEIKKRFDFVPPQRISYKNSNDWPYFYAGFEISQASMEENSAYEGLVTQNKFIFCLDASSGNSVRLIVRCIAPQMCTLTFGNQTREISNQFEEVVFENNDYARKTLRFHMQTEKSTDQLIVKEVWVQ